MPSVNTPTETTRMPSTGTGNTSDRSEKVMARRKEDGEVGPYVLGSELGKGSFAVVYKGYHEQTKVQVAIKTVSRSILTSKLLDNLHTEIDILKSLSHRHITKLIDIVRSEKNIYMIMEFCSGGDLTNYIKKRGKVETLEYIPSPGAAPIYYPHPKTGGLDEIVCRSFLRQLARALKFLRSRNLIHRDIKPQNLLLKPAAPEELARGHPLGVPILKVADFGFARILPNAMMAETLCGSPLYMAPEILRYEKYDAKADLWSVGAVLYETCVGRPPFRARNHIELLKKIEHSKGIKFPDEDQAALEADPELKPVPSDIKKLIRSLLKHFPAERSSFDEFFTSMALAKSKFPRPSATQSGEGSTSSKPVNKIQNEGEHVVVGTIKKRSRTSILPDPLIPESTRRAPPPPASELRAQDDVSVPPRFNFRQKNGQSPTTPIPEAFTDVPRGGSPPFPVGMELDPPKPAKQLPQISSRRDRHLSTEASVIPGETEEDGFLRREYVLIDTRAIEFNRTMDEIAAGRRKPLHDRSPTSEKRHSDLYVPDDLLNNGPLANNAFPPPPHPYAPPLSSSPSRGTALTRAISNAKKLFGTLPGMTRTSATPYFTDRETSLRGHLILNRPSSLQTIEDPLEEELLISLEELAQKTDVLTRWADEMYEYVKAIPQKPLPSTTNFARRDGESDRQVERRKNAEIDAEYNAVTCVALYLLLMSFSQKGIDLLRVHQEGMKMRDPEGRLEVSEGFDDALTWFSNHFLKCSDRAALVKSWLPEATMQGPAWLGQLVYDRALQLSRKAAHMELVDQGASPLECEHLYSESLWLLYALQDPLMQAGNPFREEDRVTIMSWVEKTKKRLASCRSKREDQPLDSAKNPALETTPGETRYISHRERNGISRR